MKFDTNKIKVILPVLITCIAVISIAAYITYRWNSFSQINIDSIPSVLIFIVFLLLNIYSNSQLIETLTRTHKVNLTKFESFGISAVTRFANQFIPGRLGLAFRGVYLKKKFGLTYLNFTSIMAGSQIFTFITSASFGLATSGILLSKGIIVPDYIIVFFIFLLASLTILISIPIDSAKTDFLYFQTLKRIMHGWGLIRKDTKALLGAFFWAICTIFLVALMHKWAFAIIGVNVGITECLFIASFSMMAVVMSITPAGLGVTEALVIVSGNILGIDPTVALASALLQRILTIVALLSLAPYIVRKLYKMSLTGIFKLAR